MVIPMSEAARRLGMKHGDSARRALLAAGVPMQRLHARTWVVEEGEVEKYLERVGTRSQGRPRKSAPEPPESGG